MIIDIFIFLILSFFYILDYLILNFHESTSQIILLIAFVIDILFLLLLILKIYYEKKSTYILNASFIFPTYGILKFFINFFPSLSILRQINSLQILILISIIYLYIELYLLRETHAKKKIINERSLNDDYGELGKFPIFISDGALIPEKSRFYHTQILGPTGAGKTTLLKKMMYQDIKNKAGLFILDIKTDMHEDIKKYVIHAGRDLDYYRFCLGDKESDTYNPLAGDNASEIANRVFTALYYEKGGEQYYIDIARRFLFSTIAVLKKKWKTITFKDLYIATSNPALYLQPMCTQMKDDFNARYLLDFIRLGDVENKLTGLLNKLAQFAIPEWTKQINTIEPDIEIADILTKNKILLFQANPLLYSQEYKPLSVMMMMHITSEIAKRVNKENAPFFLYLDEFYNILYSDFTEIINKVRSLKVGIIFGHQSLSDLERFGKEIKDIVVSNSRNKILLTLEDSETANYFADRIGTVTVLTRVDSFSTKDGTKQAGYTLKEEQEFKIHPNDFKYLKIGEAVIFIPVDKGKIVRKITFTPLNIKFDESLKLYKRQKTNKSDKDTNFNLKNIKKEEAVVKSTLTYKDIKARVLKGDNKESDLPGEGEEK